MSNFKVGQVWRDRYGNHRTITKILGEEDTFNVFGDSEIDGIHSFTSDGRYFVERASDMDLVELVTDVPDSSSDRDDGDDDGREWVPLQSPTIVLSSPDATRTEFIEALISRAFSGFIETGASLASDAVREAVTLRDELVSKSGK